MPPTTSQARCPSGRSEPDLKVTEAHTRPDWHASGMLLAWIGACTITVTSYIFEVGFALDALRLTVIVAHLLWIVLVTFLARQALFRTDFWNQFGATSLFVVWGFLTPLLVWGIDTRVEQRRGYPAVEGIVVSIVNIYLSAIPCSTVVGQHALFVSVASFEHWVRSSQTGIMGIAANYAVGLGVTCLLCAAHNRRTAPSFPSAAAPAAAAGGTPVEGHDWVHKAELYFLAAVPQEEAQLLVSLLCATFVGARFLAYVSNFASLGPIATSPTMDILGLLCGMVLGASKIPDLEDWAHAQHRAYRSVRALLRTIMPAHVADALEAEEAKRELAAPIAASKRQPEPILRRQSFKFDRSILDPGTTSPWPALSWLEMGTRSWSGDVKSLTSMLSCAQAPSGPPSGNFSHSRSSDLPDCEREMVPERRRSFSERHEQVTILFTDIVGFTDLSDQLHPSEVMTLLSGLYKEYDQRAVELGLYCVDAIGDCYMCAANMVQPLPNQMHAMVRFARMALKVANAMLTPLGTPLSIRVGIHTGSLMSGILGVHRLKFTVLGDTVNVASRMESTAMINSIQVSEQAYKQLQREQLAISSEAARELALDVGCPCTSPDIQGQEQGKERGMVKSSSAPCSLESLRESSQSSGVPLSELSYSTGSCQPGQAGNSLNVHEQQHKDGQPDQKHQSLVQQQRQQQFHEQLRKQEKGVKIELCKPQSQVVRCSVPHFFSTAVLAEQSSHSQQPGGLDHGLACPLYWMERELNIKGKGIMKAFTYTPTSCPRVQGDASDA